MTLSDSIFSENQRFYTAWVDISFKAVNKENIIKSAHDYVVYRSLSENCKVEMLTHYNRLRSEYHDVFIVELNNYYETVKDRIGPLTDNDLLIIISDRDISGRFACFISKMTTPM